jgi:Tripartite tricarboxylate transporter TctA family
MALMIGAIMIRNIQPGPQVMATNPSLFWGLIASMWIGNVMLIVLNLPMVGLWVKLLTVPYPHPVPVDSRFLHDRRVQREYECRRYLPVGRICHLGPHPVEAAVSADAIGPGFRARSADGGALPAYIGTLPWGLLGLAHASSVPHFVAARPSLAVGRAGAGSRSKRQEAFQSQKGG